MHEYLICPQCSRVYAELPEACPCGLVFEGTREGTGEDHDILFPEPEAARASAAPKKARGKKQKASPAAPEPEAEADDTDLWAQLEASFGDTKTSERRGMILLDDDDDAEVEAVVPQDDRPLRRLELL